MQYKGLTKENYSVKWEAGRGTRRTKLVLDQHLWIGYDSTMNTIDIIIPDDALGEIRKIIDTIPPIAVVEAILWNAGLYQESRGKLPMPRYVDSEGNYLPDVYGYTYTAMLAIVGYRLAFYEAGDK